MAFVCSATWTAQPGKEDLVHEALRMLAAASRNEPGCQNYIVHLDSEQPHVFKIFEVYDDEEAFKQHAAYPHFQEYLGKAIPALANRERVFTSVVDI